LAAFAGRHALLTPVCLITIALSVLGVRRALDLSVTDTWRDPYILAGTVCIFAFAFGEPIVRRLLSTRSMMFLGDISYSVYLTHMIAIHIVREAFEAADLPMMWTALPVVLALSIVFACATTWALRTASKGVADGQAQAHATRDEGRLTTIRVLRGQSSHIRLAVDKSTQVVSGTIPLKHNLCGNGIDRCRNLFS
jgi:hypothetical protein